MSKRFLAILVSVVFMCVSIAPARAEVRAGIDLLKEVKIGLLGKWDTRLQIYACLEPTSTEVKSFALPTEFQFEWQLAHEGEVIYQGSQGVDPDPIYGFPVNSSNRFIPACNEGWPFLNLGTQGYGYGSLTGVQLEPGTTYSFTSELRVSSSGTTKTLPAFAEFTTSGGCPIDPPVEPERMTMTAAVVGTLSGVSQVTNTIVIARNVIGQPGLPSPLVPMYTNFPGEQSGGIGDYYDPQTGAFGPLLQDGTVVSSHALIEEADFVSCLDRGEVSFEVDQASTSDCSVTQSGIEGGEMPGLCVVDVVLAGNPGDEFNRVLPSNVALKRQSVPSLVELKRQSVHLISDGKQSVISKPVNNSKDFTKSKPLQPSQLDINVSYHADALVVQNQYFGDLEVQPNSYSVNVYPGQNSCVIYGASSSCEVFGLKAGVQYTVSVSAANKFGTSPTTFLPSKYILTEAGLMGSSSKKAISGFNGDSAKLTKAFKTAINKYTKSNTGLSAVNCTGYTSGKPVTRSDKNLAKARAKAVCAYVEKIRPGLITTINGRTPGLPGGPANRKVVIRGYSALG